MCAEFFRNHLESDNSENLPAILAIEHYDFFKYRIITSDGKFFEIAYDPDEEKFVKDYEKFIKYISDKIHTKIYKIISKLSGYDDNDSYATVFTQDDELYDSDNIERVGIFAKKPFEWGLFSLRNSCFVRLSNDDDDNYGNKALIIGFYHYIEKSIIKIPIQDIKELKIYLSGFFRNSIYTPFKYQKEVTDKEYNFMHHARDIEHIKINKEDEVITIPTDESKRGIYIKSMLNVISRIDKILTTVLERMKVEKE